MSVASIKTKAEQFLASEFEQRVAALPGNLAERRAAMAHFNALGLPHRRVEAWKYTDLKNMLRDTPDIAPIQGSKPLNRGDLDKALGPLAAIDAYRFVFVGGLFSHELSDMTGDFKCSTLAERLNAGATGGVLGVPDDETIVSLNRAFVTDGAVISVAAGGKPSKPLLLISVLDGAESRFLTLRHSIELGAAAQATIIDVRLAAAAVASCQANTVCSTRLAPNATLDHVQVGLESGRATSLSTIGADLAEASVYRLFQLTVGTGLARNQSFVRLSGSGAAIDISGLMLGRHHEHCDTTLVIDHAVPSCESRELFKAVLDDNARAIFQGKVIVREGAQKTDGKQMSHALMLSNSAEFDSKPELEIYADDVVCGHGATVAEIDPELMFYLRSRGIDHGVARSMLVESFAGEALDKISDPSLQAALAVMANDWLISSTIGRAS